jgi:hypothetical protein
MYYISGYYVLKKTQWTVCIWEGRKRTRLSIVGGSVHPEDVYGTTLSICTLPISRAKKISSKKPASEVCSATTLSK